MKVNICRNGKTFMAKRSKTREGTEQKTRKKGARKEGRDDVEDGVEVCRLHYCKVKNK